MPALGCFGRNNIQIILIVIMRPRTDEDSASAGGVNSERDDEVWLSQYLPLEDIVANYPPRADARDDHPC